MAGQRRERDLGQRESTQQQARDRDCNQLAAAAPLFGKACKRRVLVQHTGRRRSLRQAPWFSRQYYSETPELKPPSAIFSPAPAERRAFGQDPG